MKIMYDVVHLKFNKPYNFSFHFYPERPYFSKDVMFLVAIVAFS